MNKIGNAFGGETRAVVATAGGSARPIFLLVEKVGDLGINVIVKELIDQFDDAGLRLDLLGRRYWVNP
jgi:hypothetical protein